MDCPMGMVVNIFCFLLQVKLLMHRVSTCPFNADFSILHRHEIVNRTIIGYLIENENPWMTLLMEMSDLFNCIRDDLTIRLNRRYEINVDLHDIYSFSRNIMFYYRGKQGDEAT